MKNRPYVFLPFFLPKIFFSNGKSAIFKNDVIFNSDRFFDSDSALKARLEVKAIKIYNFKFIISRSKIHM